MSLIYDVNQTYRQGFEEEKFSKDDWYNLLSISHRYECQGARNRSIKEINKLGSSVTNVDKIAMAKRFEVEDWLVPACVALVEREGLLTLAEAYTLGLEMTVLVSNAREKYTQVQRQLGGHTHTPWRPTSSHVQPTSTSTQLVKDILRIK